MSSERNEIDQVTQSVQEVSKQTNRRSPSLGKTDVRYWARVIFRPTYTRNGSNREVAHWAVKIQHEGRRETFSLTTANRAAASAKAKEIYLSLQSHGWHATLVRFKGQPDHPASPVTTVGDFLSRVEAIWSGNPKTLADYMRAFRLIVGEAFAIDGGRTKYDYRTGGRAEWIDKINRIKLQQITPEKIQRWKVDFLRRAGTNPAKKRSASISVNSVIRQAKSLFSPAILRFVEFELPQSPFTGVAFEPRRSMRYQSSFDIEAVIPSAQEDLPPEEFKIFLLATMAGLRRNEIDKLEWSALNFEKNLISIRTTEYFTPKSEDASGDVEVDEEVMEIFRRFKARAKAGFVIESSVAARPGASYSHYRCQKLFASLAGWLRGHGVTGSRPLHTLRKEYGSQVCAKHGIYAASRALRHSDIAITSQHYLDKRTSARADLGRFLSLSADRGPMAGPVREPSSQSLLRRKSNRRTGQKVLGEETQGGVC